MEGWEALLVGYQLPCLPLLCSWPALFSVLSTYAALTFVVRTRMQQSCQIVTEPRHGGVYWLGSGRAGLVGLLGEAAWGWPPLPPGSLTPARRCPSAAGRDGAR
uniref:Uncharacterized protein n=1 Tax=Catharus ustulatus TaxID=91951 RepID=A0A8C3XY83_CATUS